MYRLEQKTADIQMMRMILLAILVLMSSNASSQQVSYILKGRVIDGTSKEPLIGANIRDPHDLSIICLTNLSGEFRAELHERIDFVLVNYNCSWMDILVETDWENDMVIEYGTKKAKRKSRRNRKKVKKQEL